MTGQTQDMSDVVLALGDEVREIIMEVLKPVYKRLQEAERGHLALRQMVEARKPEPGKSAYDIAVQKGFQGDEVAWLESLRGEPGKDGADGRDGAGGTNGVDGKDGRDGENGAPGRDGVDGKDGAAGIDGERGLDGAPGADGKDGRAAPEIDREALIADIVRRLPPPAQPSHELVQAFVAGEVARALAAWPRPDAGRDGRDGRDALELDVLSSIDEARSYQRGTIARHLGGLWRATRQTAGMDGWECLVDGIASMTVQDGPTERQLMLVVTRSSGEAEAMLWHVPVQIYRGVYQAGHRYERGDVVTWGGSQWHCERGTDTKPGDVAEDWTLTVKRGRDGKDGDPGKEGRPGRDGKGSS